MERPILHLCSFFFKGWSIVLFKNSHASACYSYVTRPPEKTTKKHFKGNKIIFQPIDGQNQGVFFVNTRCSQLKGRVPPNIGSKEREVLEVVGASGIVLVVDVDSSVVELDADVDSLVELDEVDEPSAVSSTSCGFPTAVEIRESRNGWWLYMGSCMFMS